MAEFDDEVAAETGGASGIGRTAAERRRNSVVGVCGGNGGRHALTRNFAIEPADDGIRVNAVAPGVVQTPSMAAS